MSPVLDHVPCGQAKHLGVIRQGQSGHNVDVSTINVKHGFEDGGQQVELVKLLHSVLDLGPQQLEDLLGHRVLSHSIRNKGCLIWKDPRNNEVILMKEPKESKEEDKSMKGKEILATKKSSESLVIWKSLQGTPARRGEYFFLSLTVQRPSWVTLHCSCRSR